jgi:hypothetical protein
MAPAVAHKGMLGLCILGRLQKLGILVPIQKKTFEFQMRQKTIESLSLRARARACVCVCVCVCVFQSMILKSIYGRKDNPWTKIQVQGVQSAG